MVEKKKMRRDFSGENFLTLYFRVIYALKLRVRGSFYRHFFKNAGSWITIGKGLVLLNPKGMSLGDRVHFGRMARLESFDNEKSTYNKIEIGNDCSFGDFIHISACNSIVIGSNCLIASKVLIIDHGHGRAGLSELRTLHPKDRERFSKGGIEIGANVWIGEGVTIFAGAKVPEGAIIPAHSFVDKNFRGYR